MSVQMKIAGLSLAVAFFSAAAMASPVISTPIPNHSYTLPLAKCAPGFTANPANADNVDTHSGGKSYTCTGPVRYCMPIYTIVSPVTIVGGHMVYTCRQPEHIY
jgi:hypothetical protein